jgi:hypothetical protein
VLSQEKDHKIAREETSERKMLCKGKRTVGKICNDSKGSIVWYTFTTAEICNVPDPVSHERYAVNIGSGYFPSLYFRIQDGNGTGRGVVQLYINTVVIALQIK